MANNNAFPGILSIRAQKEIAQAWDWYEERQKSLGDRFVKEVINKIKKIEESPRRYPTRYKSYKEASVKDFPFLIIYKISRKKKFISIISIFHTSLNPKKKFR